MSASQRKSAQRTRIRRAGFTLIELMVVVGTIGVLSSIAIPSLQKYVWRTQRNEAYLNLNGIFKAQVVYFTDNGRYADTFDTLGFEVVGGQMADSKTIVSKYYTYTLDAFADADGLENGNYQAVATGDRDPSDAMLDILMIENDVTIVQ